MARVRDIFRFDPAEVYNIARLNLLVCAVGTGETASVVLTGLSMRDGLLHDLVSWCRLECGLAKQFVVRASF